MTDWKAVAAARGLHLPEPEMTKLAAAMDGLQPAAQALTANLTFDIEPVVTLGEEAVEGK